MFIYGSPRDTKDRHIIMSEDMRILCQKYDSVAGKRQWFFQKWDGTPYETSWYNQIWRKLIARSGISWREPQGLMI